MRVLDLFSGIGMFSLGLERTGGFRTVAFCEIDPYCRKVLAQHWPGVTIYGDIRELNSTRLARDGFLTWYIGIDVITGGFPCQDLSTAGDGAGLAGARSGLWREYLRLIGELRPQYAIVENVAALLCRGLGEILGDLAEIGYDTEWHCIPAAHLGAPHRRDRTWIVAYPDTDRQRREEQLQPDGDALQREDGAPRDDTDGLRATVADTVRGRCQHRGAEPDPRDPWARYQAAPGQWSTEPRLGRVVDGCPHRVDRLTALGNALVPQIAELLGRAILQAEKSPGVLRAGA